MNRINTYDGPKIPPMKISVKQTGGDTGDYPTSLNPEVSEGTSKLNLFPHNLKKTNVSGEYGVLHCKMVNTAVGTKEVIPAEYSYKVHQGLARGTKGFLTMPYVDYNAPLIPYMDSFNSGIQSRVFKAK